MLDQSPIVDSMFRNPRDRAAPSVNRFHALGDTRTCSRKRDRDAGRCVIVFRFAVSTIVCVLNRMERQE